jgi:hypothetical protein
MQHLRVVRHAERSAQLAREPSGLARRQRAALQALFERLALDVLEDQEQADDRITAHVVQRDEVGMADPRPCPRLLLHALGEPRELLTGQRQIVAQVFDRHLTIEHRIVGEQDLAHRAAPDGADDLVPADLARERGLGGSHAARARLLPPGPHLRPAARGNCGP